MGLKRERTVIEVSDEQKQKEWTELKKSQENVIKHMTLEQQKQDDLVNTQLFHCLTCYDLPYVPYMLRSTLLTIHATYDLPYLTCYDLPYLLYLL